MSDIESINSDYLPGTAPQTGHRAESPSPASPTLSDDVPLASPVAEKEPSGPSCLYCSVDSAACVAQCDHCQRYFCNTKPNPSGSSHLITHLVMSRHNLVRLHPELELGDTVLECYNCGNKNIFLLGFVSARDSAVVVVLCRWPCAQTSTAEWDTLKWSALVDGRALVPWLVTPGVMPHKVPPGQIQRLEQRWRTDTEAKIEDVIEPDSSDPDPDPVLLVYDDAFQYEKCFAPLIKMEADYDRQLKESLTLQLITVRWSKSIDNRHLALFYLSEIKMNLLRVAVGEEMVLRCQRAGHEDWEGRGYIVRYPNTSTEEYTLELKPSKVHPPTDCQAGFTAEFVWKSVTFDRMLENLRLFASDDSVISPYIYHLILGHEVDLPGFGLDLPQDLSIKGFNKLNRSQNKAVHNVLQRPLSLIQGPPGTGKTVTSATIVYHLVKQTKQKVLVCAPSNVAVDHLASKLDLLGLKVVRVTARSREDVETLVEHLLLHSKIRKEASGDLKKLFSLRDEIGELSGDDMRRFLKLIRRQESNYLKNADVVCTTCLGAGDRRLNRMEFSAVLIDELTQASEPECLLPMTKGAKQVVLVGDHQQLGPVCMDKKAGQAGLRQSLFERLILIGHVPIRLEVQYRMHPCLSEFPSNMFYEGSLQNGVTSRDRQLKNTHFPWPVKSTPMMFWASFGKEEISLSGTSYLNRVETMACEKLVTKLFLDGVRPEQIGIITPYEGQRAYVVQYLTFNGSLADRREEYSRVEVESVDAFQGREKDYIILSCVRANDSQGIGFLSDPRRMNVALTRAKFGLIVLGNPVLLLKNPLWNNLLIHFRQNGCLVEGPLDSLRLSAVPLKDIKGKKGGNFKAAGFNPDSVGTKPFGTDYLILNEFDSSFAGDSNYFGWPGENSVKKKEDTPNVGKLTSNESSRIQAAFNMNLWY